MLEQIADAVGVQSGDSCVEIGPGRGALTKHLLGRGAQVTAVEVDPACVTALATLDRGPGSLDVVEQDVLDVDLSTLVGGRVPIAGNLPYYITSPILRAVYEAAASFSRAVFLIQKEVAQRLCAEPGSRDYGFLTVITRLHATPTLLRTVPPDAFRPPPKVDSAVVALVLRAGEPPDAAFVRFVGQAFREPRKTLRNNLKPFFRKEQLADLVTDRVRAEELAVDELRAIWEQLRVAP